MNKNSIALLSVIIVSTALISFCTQEIIAKNLLYLHQQNRSTRSNNLEHLNKFTAHGDIVLVFYADWCNPCKRMAPLVTAVAATLTDITFIKINRDNFLDLARSYNTNGIPTLIFLRDGKEIGRYEGGPLTEKKLQKLITSVYS